MTKDASDNVGLYVDGTRYDTDVFPNLSLNSNGLNIFGGSFATNSVRIDELFVTTDILSDPTTVTSFTVPTQPWTDPADGTTQLLMHLNADFADDAPEELGAEFYVAASLSTTTNANFLGSADFASAFALSADTVKIEQMAATTLSSALTISVDVDKIVSVDSALSAVFSQTASYGRIRQGGTSLQASFAQNTINTRTRDYDSALNVVATQTAIIGLIKQFEVDYSAFNTQVAVVVKTGDFLVDYATQSTLSASAQTTKQGVADLDSSLGVVVSAQSTLTASSALSTATAISATGDRTRDASASFAAFNSQATVVARRRSGIADINSEFTISVTGVVFAENETLFDCTTTLTVTPPLRTRTGASTLSTNTAMSVEGIKAVEAGATLLSAGGFALSANTTASGAFDLDTATTMSVDSSFIAGGASDISTSIALSVEPSHIKGSTVELNTTAGVSLVAGALLQGEVTINSAMSFAIISKVLHLQQYVYTIPKDTRIYTIERESRAYTIPKETRTYTIEGE